MTNKAALEMIESITLKCQMGHRTSTNAINDVQTSSWIGIRNKKKRKLLKGSKVDKVMDEVIEVEVVPTKCCKPFRMDIEVETCRGRCEEIKKQFDKEGLLSLTKEQKICYGCDDGPGYKIENKANNNGGKVMSNVGLSKLNKALFDQLDRMNNPNLKGDELAEEIERTKAISEIGKQVINTGRLALDALKTVGATQRPDFLELENKGPD